MKFEFDTVRGKEKQICEEDLELEIQCVSAELWNSTDVYDSISPLQYFKCLMPDSREPLSPKQTLCAMKACARLERSYKEWNHAMKKGFSLDFIDIDASEEEIEIALDMRSPDYDTAMCLGYILFHDFVGCDPDKFFRATVTYWTKYPEYFFELLRKDDLLTGIFLNGNPERLKKFIQDALAYDKDYFRKWQDDFGNNLLHYALIAFSLKRYLSCDYEGSEKEKEEYYKEMIRAGKICMKEEFPEEEEKILELLMEAGIDPDAPDMIGISYKDLRKRAYEFYMGKVAEIISEYEEKALRDQADEIIAQDFSEESMEFTAYCRRNRRNRQNRKKNHETYHARHGHSKRRKEYFYE